MHDLILVGAGLANGLIAWRLKQLRPELDVLCLEQADVVGGNHTWSFHDADLSEDQLRWVAPLVQHHWTAYHVHFPALSRRFEGGYASITSERFAEVMGAALGERLRTGCVVSEVGPTHVRLASGERLQARCVLDGRGFAASPQRIVGQQAFLGQELRLTAPHGLEAPILMDARVEQGQGYRFVYVLPFSADTVLVEDTHYIEGHALAPETLRAHIAAYVQQRGWQVSECLREEQGILPITLAENDPADRFAERGAPSTGLRAGLFHCTTGYSLPDAVRLADWLARQPLQDAAHLNTDLRAYVRARWQQQRFYRLLNRMLFLAGRPEQRWQVMQRFHRLPEALIARFYAGQSTGRDRLRILTGKPPVPVGEAMRAALRHSPAAFKERA